MQLKGAQDQQKDTLRNKSIRRLGINLMLYRLYAVTAAQPDLRQVMVKVLLKRNGQTYVIMHDNLAVLGRMCMFFQSYESIASVTGHTLNNDDGAGQTHLQSVVLDLGETINLQGQDELYTEISCQQGWVPTGYTALNCSIEAEWREDIGTGKVIPQFRCIAIPPGSANVKESLGDNILEFGFINIEPLVAVTYLTATVQSLHVTSDRYNISDSFADMVTRRTTQFEAQAAANGRGRSFMYVPNTECDKVQIDVTLNPALITASNNYIVSRSYIADLHTAALGSNLDAKHDSRDIAKFQKTAVKAS